MFLGLYAKWGSGKSVLLNKMKDSMRSFSRSWLDSVQLSWSWSLICSVALLIAMFTLICVSVVAFFQNFYYMITVVASGLILFILWMLLYGQLFFFEITFSRILDEYISSIFTFDPKLINFIDSCGNTKLLQCSFCKNLLKTVLDYVIPSCVNILAN